MINLDLIVGARPNFMKIAPIIKAIERYNAERETWNLEPEKYSCNQKCLS